jgi:branched-chain amino acid transport system permease protein
MRLRPGLVSRRRGVVLALIALAFAAAPLVVQDAYLRHLAALGMIYATVAASWDLTLGYAGVFNFAHPALFGVGAYVSGLVSARLGLSPWIGLLIGAASAVVISILIFVPVSRLRGIYVALMTFAAAQLLLYVVVTQSDLTGGYLGLSGIPDLSIGGIAFGRNAVATYYLAGVLLLFATIVLRSVVRSDLGVSLIALRDFEGYAVSRGVSVARQRLLAFIFSAVFTGAAGGLYTFYLLSISPEVFGFSISTLLLSMVLVGGIATIYGSIVAALGLTVISDMLASLGPVRFIFISVLIVLTMRFFPGGIWGLGAALRARRRRSKNAYGAEADPGDPGSRTTTATAAQPGAQGDPADGRSSESP